MWSVLRQSLIRASDIKVAVINETKRYAGHSKWANIKHDKAVKDGERAVLFSKLIRQMNVAITEEGSSKPADNLRLAQAIEQAKRRNMPVATIKAVLDRAAKSTSKAQLGTIDIRGPSGCIMIVIVYTENYKMLKMTVQNFVKKIKGSVVDQTARHVFDHKGVIVTELKNLDEATDDAISVGAEDVEEIQEGDNKFLRFTCEPMSLPKVMNQLTTLNYTILSGEELFTPQIFANLSDDEVDRVAAFIAKLEALDEVVKVHDNIA